MTPGELYRELSAVIDNRIETSVMIWGAPGIGKSSVVQQAAASQRLRVVDVRLSQLAPTDLRGLPVAKDGVSMWYPPNFLPRDGEGVLFLDEINMAPPAMQGVAQQLILDRRVGDYLIPDGWFVWAAGNRKADRAAVFDMPAALGNRFLHYDIEADIDDFKGWSIKTGLSERILSFLLFRPTLLHKFDPQQMAWPSPRSWEMADALDKAGLSITPAVGAAAAGEFEAFCSVYENLPDLESVLAGNNDVKFPDEASGRYATVLGLAMRAFDPASAINGLKWLNTNAGDEWIQFYLSDVFAVFRENGRFGELARALGSEPDLKNLAARIRDQMVP